MLRYFLLLCALLSPALVQAAESQQRIAITPFSRTLLLADDATEAATILGFEEGSYVASAVAITGGTINGTTIGQTTPAAGYFKTDWKFYLLGNPGDASTEFLTIGTDVDNFYLVSATTGSGQHRNINIRTTAGNAFLALGTNGINRWKLDGATGHLLPNVDSTYNIGAPGTEVLNVYADTVTVSSEVYGVGWDADLSVPTKDAVYDKIQTMGGGTTVATDTIWNVAGDLVQGTGSDTAARLAIGTAGQFLTVNAGATAVEWTTLPSYQPADSDLTDLADGSLTGSKVGFADTDNVWTATNIQAALEELNDNINGGSPNGTGAKVHWSQLLGVPAGFADNTDDGAGGGSGTVTSVKEGGTLVGTADAVAIDFNGTDFGVSASTTNRIITIKSGITRDSEVNGYFADPTTNGSFSVSNWQTALDVATTAYIDGLMGGPSASPSFSASAWATDLGFGASVATTSTASGDVLVYASGPGEWNNYSILDPSNLPAWSSTASTNWRTDIGASAQAPILLITEDGIVTPYGVGDTTDVQRGTSLRNACNALTADDKLVIGVATFDIGANVLRTSQFPARVSITGAGPRSTIIKTQGTSASGVLWEPGDDNYIANLQFYGNLLNGSSQLLFGNDADTVDAATGVVRHNVWFRADSDCDYFLHATNAMELTTYDSIIESKFDTVYPSGAAHTLRYDNCQIISNETGSGANSTDAVRGVRLASGTVTLTDCQIDITLPSGDFLSESNGVTVLGGTLHARNVTVNLTDTTAAGTASGVFVSSGAATLDNVRVNTAITSGATGRGIGVSSGTLNFNSGRVTTLSGVGTHLVRSGGTLNVSPNTTWSSSSGTLTYSTIFGVTPGATFIALADDATASAARDTLGATSGVFPGTLVEASSTGARGTVELATAAEINTGSDTSRALGVNEYRQSNWAKWKVPVSLHTDGSDLTTGDGKAFFGVPSEYNGYKLIAIKGFLKTASSSGTPLFQIRRVRSGTPQDMCSTGPTFDASEQFLSTSSAAGGAGYTIDTASGNDIVQTDDLIYIDCDTAGTGTKNPQLWFVFQLP